MPKLTLLEMSQDILSDMNSDNVNTIDETPDSLQVAQIVKSTYYDMIGNKNWPHLRQLTQLEASADNTKPTHMKLPDLVKELEWVTYNRRKTADTSDKFEVIEFCYPDEFLAITNQYKTNETTVDQITDFSSVVFNIRNDESPRFWTSFDDDYLVFNSYDSVVDTILQASKTQASVFKEPTWSMVDSFIPDLPSEAFPALLADAKSACFLRLKQMPDQKSEQQAARQRNWMSRKAWRVNGGIRFPSYGRKTGKQTFRAENKR
jgi:hypothetical protein